MKTYLYIDDERTPKTDHPWVIVRNYHEATEYVRAHGIPDYISFDHDLGEIESGYDFTKWLVEEEITKRHLFPVGFEWNVHSANPVGAANIDSYLKSYFDFRDND